jgi:hypothetical protein
VIVILFECWGSSPWPRPTATPDVHLYEMCEIRTVLVRGAGRALQGLTCTEVTLHGNTFNSTKNLCKGKVQPHEKHIFVVSI